MINNYFYGYSNDISGAYFVNRDPEEIAFPSGLYFWRDDRTSVGMMKESGSMWK